MEKNYSKNTQARTLSEYGKIKSGNLPVDYEIDKVLEDIESMQLNTINVPVIVQVKNLSSSDMKIDLSSKKKAIKLIKKLNNKNINVILEAYPWIRNGNDYETQWEPSDVDLFFKNWEENVLIKLVDDIARPYKIFAINIASNFVYMEEYEESWIKIIDNIREKFDGFITYRTSWWYTAVWDKKTIEDYNNKLNNNLFGSVDFISVAAYFELSDKDINSKDELVQCMHKTTRYNRQQNIKEELYNFYEKWEKPVFFGELGFPKLNGATKEPWNIQVSTKPNSNEQKIGFEAYKEVFGNESWQLGFSIFAIGEDDNEKLYYPSEQTKELIKDWYEKS